MSNAIATRQQTSMTLASDTAHDCKSIVSKTAVKIQGKSYICVEGWQAISNRMGCMTSAVNITRCEGGIRATGQVRRIDTGEVIAEAEGFVGDDENTWKNRPEFARRAMAQTRAISRACRSAFAFVVTMMDAGLETTPAEEMPSQEVEVRPKFARQPPKTVEESDPLAQARLAVDKCKTIDQLDTARRRVTEKIESGEWTEAQAAVIKQLIMFKAEMLQGADHE